MASGTKRPFHNLTWPWSPSQVEALNDMLARIFTRLGNTRIGGQATLSVPGASLADGEWEIVLYDDGTDAVLRVRYNRGGTILTSDIGPLT